MKAIRLFSLFTVISVFIIVSTSCNFLGNCVEGEGSVVTKEIPIVDFDKITVSSNVKVFVKQNQIPKVTIKAPQNIIDILSTDVSRGEWDIEFDKCVETAETIEIYIEMPTLKEARVNGSGDIINEGTFEGNVMELTIDGSGSITLDLNIKELKTDISGSGDITLSGVTKLNSIEINGSGDVKALDLRSDETEIEINGSGDAKVNVSYSLDVEINGSGDVYYEGDVKDMKSSINGSGKLHQQN